MVRLRCAGISRRNPSKETRMKTKEEIKDEIIELYGATQALSEAMNQLHKQQMETTKKLFALNNMLREMEDKNET